MKEIKFRGQKCYDKEWIYGSLLILTTGYYIVPTDTYYNELSDSDCGREVIYNAIWEYNDFEKVISETVGQDIGLKDKNGKEIYEGDIINRINFYDKKLSENYIITWSENYIITWSEKYLSWYAEGFGTLRDIGNDIKIIGNIYENSELLEVEE